EVVAIPLEPARIEYVEVVGHDQCAIGAPQRVVGEVHGQCAAAGEARDLRDHIVERHRILEVAIHRVQTGGSAGRIVRLAQDLEVECVAAGRRHEGGILQVAGWGEGDGRGDG